MSFPKYVGNSVVEIVVTGKEEERTWSEEKEGQRGSLVVLVGVNVMCQTMENNHEFVLSLEPY